MSCTPVFTSGALVFTAAVQRLPLHLLALMAIKPCVSRFHRAVMMRKAVLGRLPPSGHCTDSRLKHTPNFSMKEALMTGLRFDTHLEVVKVPSVNTLRAYL